MIEQLISAESLSRPASRFYYFRTQAGGETDLIVVYLGDRTFEVSNDLAIVPASQLLGR